MADQDAAETKSPFSALAGVSSLLAALLYVAGFAFRWSYFYNFGVQHLVFKLGFASFLVAAFELIRTPAHIARVLTAVVVPLLVLNLLIAGAARAVGHRRFPGGLASSLRRSGLRTPLLLDLLRAATLVYATYYAASSLGYETFLAHIRNDAGNPLSAVTVVMDAGKESAALALACGAGPKALSQSQFIGDAARLHELQAVRRTCNSDGRVTWRLLYRDDEAIVVFAAQAVEADGAPAAGARPLTLVLPNRGDVALVME